MASLCTRSARSWCRRAFLRRLSPPFSDHQAPSPSCFVAGHESPDAQFPSWYTTVRAFCAPHTGKDGFQTPPSDPHTKEPEVKPSPDNHFKEKEEVPDEKTQVLRAALLHVPKLGWSESALVAGARDVGLSPAIVGVFPRKEAALVEFFMDESLHNLLDYIESHEDELASMLLQERLAKLVQCRLEMQAPLISRWAQALSIQANPANVPASFKQRAVLVDDIWHAVGDHSSDVDWYAKRTILGGLYTATELYMLTDHSPGFRDTWSFLQRRVKDALDCRKTAQEASQIAQAIGAGLGNSLQGLFRR
ncbi:hypothetical protein GOP47_0023511 [Adiantum capillus-veneris]|uniref:Ubiquinone biosynthesis protein n=1 Tax=Adiantum capillus-veneris TaxID=13818 RepID=A0A9D4U672_ADICA|nr:hypothetical protein GOP47_0023511 [Adiantum capillus-veneris]